MGVRNVLLAIGAGAAAAALVQPAAGADTADSQPQREQVLLEKIEALQREGGLNAEGLIDPLRELGLLYEEAGSHAQAIAALTQARQVLRANRGLFAASVDEALLLQQQIRSERALGNGERVWNLQHELTIIARQNRDDIRMLPVFTDLIEDRTQRLDAFSNSSFRELPPGIYVPCGTDYMPIPLNSGNRAPPAPVTDARNCPFGTWRVVVDRLQGAVIRNYGDAISVLLRNHDFRNPELRRLEREALSLIPFERALWVGCSFGTFGEFLAADLADSCLDPAVGFGVGGWPSLMRMVHYEARSGTASTRANAYAELGDWYLRAEHVAGNARRSSKADEFALILYAQAMAEVAQDVDARQSMAQLFAPEVPITLPTHAPNPLATAKSSRFIDVAFEITRDGAAADIEILSTGKGATRGEERELTRVIKFASFRPRVVDGEIAEAAPVTFRYYLPELSAVSSASTRSAGG